MRSDLEFWPIPCVPVSHGVAQIVSGPTISSRIRGFILRELNQRFLYHGRSTKLTSKLLQAATDAIQAVRAIWMERANADCEVEYITVRSAALLGDKNNDRSLSDPRFPGPGIT